MSKIKDIVHEIKHHLPSTAFATIVAILVVVLIQFIIKKDISESAFELLHPLHVLVSAIATAGIFYKYKKSKLQALFVGIMGAILIGSLSDIFMPCLGGAILSLQPEFHLPIVEEPFIMLGTAMVGSLFGIGTKVTKNPHRLHVFLSVFASLFYLLAFTSGATALYFIAAFFIVVIAVVVPCCLSDIIFPFFFLGKKLKTCNC